MSNKADVTDMNQEEKHKLKPNLRFPEFRDVPGWKKDELGNLGELVSGLTYSPEDIREKGLLVLRSSNVQNGEICLEDNVYVTPEIKGANFSKPNDILICVRNGSKSLIGKNALIPEGMPLCTHGAFMTVFRSQFAEFVFQLFQTSAYQSQVDADLGATTNSINGSHFIRYKFYIPLPQEQQKISDCLSSLDDRITAETQKLDTLKVHKKGLMHLLFPAEGETLPKLRFPEFCNAGEWEEKLLGAIVEVASGQVDPMEPPYCDLPHIGGENIESHTGNLHTVKTARELRLISGKYLFNEGDVLYSKIRPALNKVAIPDFKGICSADIYPLRPSDDKLCQRYLAYLLLSEGFLEYAIKHSERSKIPKINRDSLLAYKVVIPLRPEQQRIADCLTTLEDLITAQTQKIDTLKTHKKGLMQQLFPALDEVTG